MIVSWLAVPKLSSAEPFSAIIGPNDSGENVKSDQPSTVDKRVNKDDAIFHILSPRKMMIEWSRMSVVTALTHSG